MRVLHQVMVFNMDVVDLRCFEHIERVDKYRFSAESGLTPLERILYLRY